MDVTTTTRIAVTEPSGVAESRRRAETLAHAAGFSAERVGALAIIVTELASNLVKHTRAGGQILLNPSDDGAAPLIDVLATDSGPGIPDPALAVRDGYSTAGSPGTGLGAVRRLVSDFDLYSRPESGTAILARVAADSRRAPAPLVQVAGLTLAKAGEEVAGDAWAALPTAQGARLLVVDGLGHGPDAARAAYAAVASFRRHPQPAPGALCRCSMRRSGAHAARWRPLPTSIAAREKCATLVWAPSAARCWAMAPPGISSRTTARLGTPSCGCRSSPILGLRAASWSCTRMGAPPVGTSRANPALAGVTRR